MKSIIKQTVIALCFLFPFRGLGQIQSSEKYLRETQILNYSHQSIQLLIKQNGWTDMDTIERVKSIYNFVRDEIKFGYNTKDHIPASKVLEDGYGQCNTKATLLMALLRVTGVPNRIHGFTIDKSLQKGAIKGVWYRLSPDNIIHSWVEVNISGEWYFLEGVILDKTYLSALQSLNSDCAETFCGFGAYTDNFQNPSIDWELNHTYIQEKGINNDFGVFDTPDDFYASHSQSLSRFKKFIFRYYVRHRMNKNVNEIRNQFNN